MGRRKRSDQVDVKVREPPGRDGDVERNSPDMNMMLNFPLLTTRTGAKPGGDILVHSLPDDLGGDKTVRGTV